MTGRVAEVAAVSALALILTLAIAAPVLRAPSDRIFGMEIVGRHYDPFTVMQQFGRPIALGVYWQPVTDVPGALLARVSSPVAAYNWLVLLTFPLSAAAAYLLARYLTLSPVSAVIPAIAFAFSPFHLAHAAYHPHVAQMHWVPLYFLALWRCLDNSTPAAVGFLAVSIAGVTLSNFYGGLIAAVITPLAITTYWFFKSRLEPGSPGRLVITVATLVVIASGGVAYAWHAAHGVVVNRAAFAFPLDDLFRYSAKWWSYLVPPVAHPLLGGIAKHVWDRAGVDEGLLEQQVSLGWGLVALGLVAVFGWLVRDRHATSLATVPVLATVAFVALVCSLSPERTIGPFTFTRPSAFLYSVVPMFRSYARFGAVVQLMAALLAGIGAERLWRFGTRRARIACVTLLAIAAGEYAVWPPALWRDVLPTTAHRWVAERPNRVHVLDCAPLTLDSASIEWLTGYRISLRRGWFDDCTEPNFRDKLSAAGYTHLLVRRDTAEGRWFASQRTPEGLEVAARFGDGEVFAVTARTPLVYTAQMTAFYSREYDESWTWRWMGPEASWKVVNRSDRPIIAAVDVEMTAFHGARRLKLLLDGREVQTLIVQERRGLNRIGPLALTPGDHELVFHPTDPPTVADDLMNNGDRRPLSFGFGTWHWAVESERRDAAKASFGGR
ncbi:MAG: hypothetical protein H0W18_17225 [Acidobacteria bacterium]|nr:hypothetical protein [Acidobacteriota bacterium]